MIVGKSVLEFGNGDIGIGLREIKNKNNIIPQYCVIFKNIETLPVGSGTFEKRCELDEYPVRMIFSNIESLDVLLKRLNQLRRIMIEND